MPKAEVGDRSLIGENNLYFLLLDVDRRKIWLIFGKIKKVFKLGE